MHFLQEMKMSKGVDNRKVLSWDPKLACWVRLENLCKRRKVKKPRSVNWDWIMEALLICHIGKCPLYVSHVVGNIVILKFK